jgi:hypothetical protein
MQEGALLWKESGKKNGVNLPVAIAYRAFFSKSLLHSQPAASGALLFRTESELFRKHGSDPFHHKFIQPQLTNYGYIDKSACGCVFARGTEATVSSSSTKKLYSLRC